MQENIHLHSESNIANPLIPPAPILTNPEASVVPLPELENGVIPDAVLNDALPQVLEKHADLLRRLA